MLVREACQPLRTVPKYRVRPACIGIVIGNYCARPVLVTGDGTENWSRICKSARRSRRSFMPTSAAESRLLSAPAIPPAPSLVDQYLRTRKFSHLLCETLEPEDYVIQSMPDASPTKWHLAHTSWFFETFLLKTRDKGYVSPFPQYNFLFNSYYNAVGERHCRPRRGLLARPTVRETYEYRGFIDAGMVHLLENAGEAELAELEPLVTLGIHHEQQHQELLLTDIKHAFAQNPLLPVFCERKDVAATAAPLDWLIRESGLYEVGHQGEGFSFDNESPRHKVWLEAFALANRPVTNGEWLQFMEEGGYSRPEFWLSAGWSTVQQEGWTAPLYWENSPQGWRQFTLSGLRTVVPEEPVTHVSYFEADAYARWAGYRLPTEFEWEVVAAGEPLTGNYAESGHYHPVPTSALGEFFGNVWQWTRSQYSPYPGYAPAPGALGEYNGKFMCNQFVLRGGSCATSETHIRASYRNFFPPDARWQFSGLRLARDV